jgi:hypothetical protein
MEATWSRIPNTLLEEANGKLWLTFTGNRFNCGEPTQSDLQSDPEAVTVEEALEWLQQVLEFCDGYDGDPADICRLALREIRSRPSPLEMVRRAVREDRKHFPKGSELS